jgi:P pilus assembly chaperone PapD
MKSLLKNYSYGKNGSMKSALTLMLFVLAIQPGFLLPLFVSSALAETRGVGKGILVAPVKLEFEGRTRSGTFKVLNRDSEVVDYRVSFAPLVAKRVSLNPGEHQTIRVVVRKPLDLAPGEYTARIMIQAIPKPRKKPTEPTDKIQVNLDIVYGVSIPVIIKHNP